MGKFYKTYKTEKPPPKKYIYGRRFTYSKQQPKAKMPAAGATQAHSAFWPPVACNF
jgi:hypothetical protein